MDSSIDETESQMARKTKAEVLREHEQRLEDQWADFVAQYPERFTRLLIAFYNMRVKGYDCVLDYNEAEGEVQFNLDHYDSGAYCDKCLPCKPDVFNPEAKHFLMYNFSQAELQVSDVKEWETRMASQAQKRKDALAKLTKEEKELLGL
jgi:hypothetical protein